MVRNQRDHGNTAFTVTNHTADLDMDANGAVAVVADTLGSLIIALGEAGIIDDNVS